MHEVPERSREIVERLIGFAIYMLIGILGRMVFGYRGLVETILWPVGIPCAVLLKRMEVNDEIDQDNYR